MPTYTGGEIVWAYDNITARVDDYRATWTNSTVHTTTAATTNLVSVVWQDWQTSPGTTVYTWQSNQIRNIQNHPPLNTEELAAQEERRRVDRERRERRWRRQQRRYQLAEIRARRLLAEVLTDEQRREYEEQKSFTVRVHDPRVRSFRSFRINHALAGNITELNGRGRPIRKYCIHLTGAEPVEDSMIAQKLMLETDIAQFERIANASRV